MDVAVVRLQQCISFAIVLVVMVALLFIRYTCKSTVFMVR